ncbi:hypothetical protein N566_24075 [Streptomycetaceae bacterium MP113-05]|nr:hypothetical protein N566_24075 [Streptomycetaceae bacterium MP113-05]
MADMSVPDPVTRDILAIFERARSRLFERLEDLTDAEYHWEPVSDCISIRPGDDGVFRVATLFPESSPEAPDPLTTIAWRIWHIGNLCLRGYVVHFFEDVPELGDRHEWPGTAKEGIQALAEDWEHFIGISFVDTPAFRQGRKRNSCGAGQEKPVCRQGGPASTSSNWHVATN